MNKTLAETLKLLLNNQKLLADQMAVLNEKIKVIQQLQGHKIIKAHKVSKHTALTTVGPNGKATIH